MIQTALISITEFINQSLSLERDLSSIIHDITDTEDWYWCQYLSMALVDESAYSLILAVIVSI